MVPQEPPPTVNVSGAPLTGAPLGAVTLTEIVEVDPSPARNWGEAEIDNLSGGYVPGLFVACPEVVGALFGRDEGAVVGETGAGVVAAVELGTTVGVV